MPTLSAARIPASKASTVAAHGKSHGSTVAPAQHKVSRTAQSNSASAEVSQIKELQVENARLLASEQEMQAQHAKCKVVQEEAQRMLALTQQRESDLAMLLESAGHNALTTMPIDWSVPEARDALQTDQEDQLVLDRYAAAQAALIGRGRTQLGVAHITHVWLTLCSPHPTRPFLLLIPGWSTR